MDELSFHCGQMSVRREAAKVGGSRASVIAASSHGQVESALAEGDPSWLCGRESGKGELGSNSTISVERSALRHLSLPLQLLHSVQQSDCSRGRSTT